MPDWRRVFKTAAVALAASAVLVFCHPLNAETPAQKQTVLDYFMRLPDKYFEVTQQGRKDLVSKENRAIVDVPQGYLRAPGDGAQPTLEVALFKQSSGGYLVGVCHNRDDENDGFLDFYVEKNGKLVEKNGMLPIKYNAGLIYTLPRHGTTISVNSSSGKTSYKLAWNGSRFEKKQ